MQILMNSRANDGGVGEIASVSAPADALIPAEVDRSATRATSEHRAEPMDSPQPPQTDLPELETHSGRLEVCTGGGGACASAYPFPSLHIAGAGESDFGTGNGTTARSAPSGGGPTPQ